MTGVLSFTWEKKSVIGAAKKNNKNRKANFLPLIINPGLICKLIDSLILEYR